VNSLSRIPPSLAEPPLRRKPALSLRLYEFLRRADFSNSGRIAVCSRVRPTDDVRSRVPGNARRRENLRCQGNFQQRFGLDPSGGS